MTFDFSPVLEYIGVTAQYSNAVLVAIMPHISDFATKLELPIPTPITASQVSKFTCNNWRSDLGGTVTISNYCTFSFNRGHVTGFEGPRSYFAAQNPDDIPKFFGPLKMNEAEALQFARTSIQNLGYSLESVYADLAPHITSPPIVGTNVVPYYKFEWSDPRGGSVLALEVNANRKRIEKMWSSNPNWDNSPPKISVEPATLPKNHPLGRMNESGFNPEYGYKLLPIVLKDIEAYGQRLKLPLPVPLTTNYVARFHCEDNGGWPAATLLLTNGWRFIYRNNQVSGYFASDDFFGLPYGEKKKKMLVNDFAGSWKMSDSEVIAFARKTVSQLKYPVGAIHTDSVPTLLKPTVDNKASIPRCLVEWMYPDQSNMQQWIRVEVDTNKKLVKSLYFDDSLFWTNRPAINVPIALSSSLNQPEQSANPPTKKPTKPTRPFVPYDTMPKK